MCAFKAHIRRSELCLFLCPPTLEFGVIWYETLIREKRELMPGFIGPSAQYHSGADRADATVNRRVARFESCLRSQFP